MLFRKLILKIQQFFAAESGSPAPETGEPAPVTRVTAEEVLLQQEVQPQRSQQRREPGDKQEVSLPSLVKFVQLLLETFSESEFREICHRLDIDYRKLPARAYNAKARELVLYLQRRACLQDLVNICQERAPNVDWEIMIPADDHIEHQLQAMQGNPDQQLYILVSRYLNYSELYDLAAELDLEMESFPGDTFMAKSSAFVNYLAHQRRLPELLDKLRNLRPHVPSIQNLQLDPMAFITPDRYPAAKQAIQERIEDKPFALQKHNNPGKLLQMFSEHFNEDELAELCFDVGIDYEDLPGRGRAHVRELVAYIERRKRSLKSRAQISTLIAACHELRPDVDWAAAVGIELDREKILTPVYRQGYNTSAIRKLLQHIFTTDEAFTDFCRTHFPEVLLSFGSEMSFREKIQSLLGFFLRRGYLEDFLQAIEKAYPDHFARFGPYMADQQQ